MGKTIQNISEYFLGISRSKPIKKCYRSLCRKLQIFIEGFRENMMNCKIKYLNYLYYSQINLKIQNESPKQDLPWNTTENPYIGLYGKPKA